ncbi:MAG TPA: hypothetical protein VK970_22525, partial [Candidatus Methylacidiphilales bacterium]|nr:hypothetical protein [Candidatus Methylacidiphilales bacterium]
MPGISRIIMVTSTLSELMDHLMNSSPLTARQKQVLNFITEYKAKEGIAPSRREIQGHFGFKSLTAASDHVRLIEKKGRIQIAPEKHAEFWTA